MERIIRSYQKKCDSAIQYLGLALPETEHYIRELKRRVRKPLRQKLNLWILLYDIGSGKIKAIELNQELK